MTLSTFGRLSPAVQTRLPGGCTGVVQFRPIFWAAAAAVRSQSPFFIPLLPRRPRRASRRYTIVLADRHTGVYRRFCVNPKPVVLATFALFALPVLVGLGIRWSARAEIAQLQTSTEVLEVENRSYRAATGELTAQLQSLQAAVTQIGDGSALDPRVQRAIERLPAVVKSRAAGGPPPSASEQRPLGVRPRLQRAGRHIRRPPRPAVQPRGTPADRAGRSRAPSGAGGRDPDDLARPGVAHRRLRQTQRSVHRRSRSSTAGWTSPRTVASPSMPPRMAPFSRLRLPAHTAT